MVMAIDKSRQQRHARYINHLGAVRQGYCGSRPHGLDTIAVNQHRHVSDYGAARAVYEISADQSFHEYTSEADEGN